MVNEVVVVLLWIVCVDDGGYWIGFGVECLQCGVDGKRFGRLVGFY